jgi:glyoxylase-like metal-dependent hydrolase (beta-lactamase superfamily II)
MQIYNYLTGPLSVNTYLVVDEESNKGFIVDPGGEDKRLLKFVDENNIEIDYIILTHGHGDHICGIDSYRRAWPLAKVVAHENEIPLLKDAKKNYSSMTCGFPVTLTPDIAVKDGDELLLGREKLSFFATPGHTPGGMSIYTEGSLFVGDTLFAGSVGRTDFPGSSFNELKQSIEEKIYTLPDDTKVYPGHMGPTTVRYEKEHNPFV